MGSGTTCAGTGQLDCRLRFIGKGEKSAQTQIGFVEIVTRANQPIKQGLHLDYRVDVECDIAKREPTGAGLGCDVPKPAGKRQRGKAAEQHRLTEMYEP